MDRHHCTPNAVASILISTFLYLELSGLIIVRLSDAFAQTAQIVKCNHCLANVFKLSISKLTVETCDISDHSL